MALPSFFNHLIFPKNNFKLDLRYGRTPQTADDSLVFAALHNSLRKIEDAYEGLATSRLWVDQEKLVCWKPNETQQDFDSESKISSWTLDDGSELYAPTSLAHGFLISKSEDPPFYVPAPYPVGPMPSTNIVTFRLLNRMHSKEAFNTTIFESLRLNQLVSLAVKWGEFDRSVWRFAGELPCLESLEADVPFGQGPYDWPPLGYLLEALSPATGRPLPFPALVSLTICEIGFIDLDDLRNIFKLRTQSQLPRLRWLGFVNVNASIDTPREILKLHRLEEFVDDVKFNSEKLADSFVDPKIEGLFNNSTSDSRVTAQKYIEQQIDAHRAIICYYKRHLNALTVTCRIPPEVLACIFSKIVEDATVTHENWIGQISHVCFHWRKVAISTPHLWSTIFIQGHEYCVVDPKDRALAMLQRSKGSPLSVLVSNETHVHAKYYVLKEALTFHLPRIRELIIYTTFEIQKSRELLQLLASRDALMMKRLTMKTSCPTKLDLPDRFITQSASLETLSLRGYGLNWEILHGFQNLKTLALYLPPNFAPSNAQMLHFLSRTPLLERLTIDSINPSDREGLPSYNAQLIHLKFVDVVCHMELPS
ncbi:hypothetical protein H0H92_010757, partial [Tricholoma furcatifolium]